MKTTEDLKAWNLAERCNLQRLATAEAMMKSICSANSWWQPTLSRRHSVSKLPESLEFVAQQFGGVLQLEFLISGPWLFIFRTEVLLPPCLVLVT